MMKGQYKHAQYTVKLIDMHVIIHRLKLLIFEMSCNEKLKAREKHLPVLLKNLVKKLIYPKYFEIYRIRSE